MKAKKSRTPEEQMARSSESNVSTGTCQDSEKKEKCLRRCINVNVASTV